jgi:hypothetical protein
MRFFEVMFKFKESKQGSYYYHASIDVWHDSWKVTIKSSTVIRHTSLKMIKGLTYNGSNLRNPSTPAAWTTKEKFKKSSGPKESIKNQNLHDTTKLLFNTLKSVLWLFASARIRMSKYWNHSVIIFCDFSRRFRGSWTR